MARAKKAPPPTHEEFVFHVRAPSLTYHFGIEHNRRRREWRPFDEHQTVNFVTECIWPDRFKGREGKATLYPEPAFIDHKLLDQDDVGGSGSATSARPRGSSRRPSGCRRRSAGGWVRRWLPV